MPKQKPLIDKLAAMEPAEQTAWSKAASYSDYTPVIRDVMFRYEQAKKSNRDALAAEMAVLYENLIAGRRCEP